MAAEELVNLSLKSLSSWRQVVSSRVEMWRMCFSSVGGSLWHISWLAYLCSSLSLVCHMVGQPIDKLMMIFIIDQILFSYIFSLTLQANFAGSCRATFCGHSASQSTRYILGLPNVLDVPPAVSFPFIFFYYFFYNILTEMRKRHSESCSFLIVCCGHESKGLALTEKNTTSVQHHEIHVLQLVSAIY